MAKRRTHTRRHRKSKRKGSYRKTKSTRNRRSRMYGGRLDRDQKQRLREAIAPVRALMLQDNAFDADVKRFFSNEETYFEQIAQNENNPVQRMDPWLLRNELPNERLDALQRLFRDVRLLGDTESNLYDVIAILNSEMLINNEDLETIREMIHDYYHALSNNGPNIIDPNAI